MAHIINISFEMVHVSLYCSFHQKNTDLENIYLRLCMLTVVFFKKNILPAHQTAWIQTRPDNFSGLIWIKTFCKGYQQTTLFVVCCFLKIHVFEKSLNTIRVSNSLAGQNVVPDLGPNCLQRLSADDTRRQ